MAFRMRYIGPCYLHYIFWHMNVSVDSGGSGALLNFQLIILVLIFSGIFES